LEYLSSKISAVATVFLAVLGAVMLAEGCAHKSTPPPTVANVAVSGGLCLQDLTGEPVDQGQLEALIATLNAVWAEQVTAFDTEMATSFLLDKPLIVFMVGGALVCSEVAGAGTWPGDLANCYGLWPNTSQTIFLKRNHSGLHCTSLAHELSHIYSWYFHSNADNEHKNPVIWGKHGIVAQVVNSFPQRCPKR
jgi:hypothetical protein